MVYFRMKDSRALKRISDNQLEYTDDLNTAMLMWSTVIVIWRTTDNIGYEAIKFHFVGVL